MYRRSGEIKPYELCAMDFGEFASDAVKRQRADHAERQEAALRNASTGTALFSYTRSTRCPECGGREARFTHVGTDMKAWHGRKNEVWGSRHDEDEEPDCLIVCYACGHEWRGDAPTEYVEPEPEVERKGILGGRSP